ncbi:uncharacterized protein PAC_14340 [Phialocephala subalpina]|uniref:Clr5 domain-containing protein n=1 Tax=Phialocephala subalpina TaxID=576137 RepID=A0A1L7XHD3_9HELO|nr:uncharacterized protein PAC_14340 [Phialocephala subalpina]
MPIELPPFTMQPSSARGYAPSVSYVPLPERWQQLKPAILELYLQRNVPLPQIINIMKEAPYYFHAVENSYKYYFTQWGVTKNIPALVKDAALTALGKRTRVGYSTPEVWYKKGDDQILPIDKKRIKRHIKTVEVERSKKADQIQLGNNVFIHWNLPYRAARSSSRAQQFSPFGLTPDFLSIASPNYDRSMSSRSAPSPNNAPTPTMLAVRSMKLDERTQLFIEAKHDDLLKQLEGTERKLLTTYLYQFWLFSFCTAKYWGYGPTLWTAELLEFDRFKDKDRASHSSTNTPMANAGTPRPVDTPRSVETPRDSGDLAAKPTQLCKWTIHAAIRTRYEGQEQEIDENGEARTGLNDGEDLHAWPSGHQQTFEQKLQLSLEMNNFTTLDPKDLPMAVSKVVKAARSSPRELLQESFAFSLVARNERVFWSLLCRASSLNFVGTGIYPLHLLTSFLDGSKTCCNLLDAALNHLAGGNRIDKIYVNDHGHTVLDNLFISILKGHTNCLPDVVDDKFSKMKRFTGEEVDICGRWDADSTCVRELFAEGHSTIPIEWKHMFCHTSVQAICHCIGRLFGPMFAPDINTLSGLFMKTCQCCGQKLQMGPLHSLVLTAVHLAQSGCPGENLFGMLACLVCLLANGADPTLTAPISLPALMRKDTATACSHEEINPFQLAERVPASLVTSWSDDVTLGWKVLCAMLRYAKDERRPKQKPLTQDTTRKERADRDVFMGFAEEERWDNSDNENDSADGDENECSEDQDDEDICPHFKQDTNNFYGQSKVIGTLWAAIQTELLTYRRLADEDPWLSENFAMQAVLEGLENGGMLPIKLIEEDMIAPYCRCGRFLGVTDEACACVDEVCTHYFANVDVWSRASYIMIPEGENGSWYW